MGSASMSSSCGKIIEEKKQEILEHFKEKLGLPKPIAMDLKEEDEYVCLFDGVMWVPIIQGDDDELLGNWLPGNGEPPEWWEDYNVYVYED